MSLDCEDWQHCPSLISFTHFLPLLPSLISFLNYLHPLCSLTCFPLLMNLEPIPCCIHHMLGGEAGYLMSRPPQNLHLFYISLPHTNIHYRHEYPLHYSITTPQYHKHMHSTFCQEHTSALHSMISRPS